MEFIGRICIRANTSKRVSLAALNNRVWWPGWLLNSETAYNIQSSNTMSTKTHHSKQRVLIHWCDTASSIWTGSCTSISGSSSIFHTRTNNWNRLVNTQIGRGREFSSEGTSINPNVSYEELLELLDKQDGNTLVIDVREPQEIDKTGLMPGAINIPLREIGIALKGPAEKFRDTHGIDQPGKDVEIVFSCLAGMRSMTSLSVAQRLGYTKARHYPGGWQQWAEKQNGPSKAKDDKKTRNIQNPPPR